jgi:hypothetical protein
VVSWSPSITARPRGALQQRRLAGAGGAHQVDREDAAGGEPGPVLLGQAVVLGQDLLLELDGPASRPVPVVVPRPVLVPLGVAAIVLVRVLVLRVLVLVRGLAVVAEVARAEYADASLVTAAAGRAHVRPPPRT